MLIAKVKNMSLRKKLDSAGIMADDLDDVVLDISNDIVSNVNNSGVKGQIEYLNTNGYSDDDIWKKIVMDNLKKDMCVKFTKTENETDEKPSSLYGHVLSIDDDSVCIQQLSSPKVELDVNFNEIAIWNCDEPF